MKIKKSWSRRIRGWFPQEPTLSIIKNSSTKDERKNDNWALCPYLVPGALMIFAALLSANFGLTLVSVYLPGFPAGDTVFYSGLYVGILSVTAFVLGLISGGLLLAGKRIHIAVTGIAIIFCFGLATIILPTLEGLGWTSGLIVASPMIAFPVISLIQVGLNSKKLKAYNAIQEPKLTIEVESPINRRPVAAGLGAAGCGFILVGLLLYFMAPIFPGMINSILIVTGVSLLVAAYLEKRTYKH